MIRRILIAIGALSMLSFAFGALLAHAGGAPVKTRPPRFSPPINGKPGYVNDVEYFSMEDPRAAARTLLAEAAAAQLDINRPGESTPQREIAVPSGRFEPKKDDQLFLESAPVVGDTICLIKLVRVPSIKEIADIMNLGVRLFKGVPHYTYIARVPFQSLSGLRDDPLVEWVGPYNASQKIPPIDFQAGQPVSVFTLVGNQPSFQRDLEEIGATVLNYSESVGRGWAFYYYAIQVDVALIPQITSLWWVESIGPHYARSGRGNSAQATTYLAAHVRPNDSRRLVSDVLNSPLYEGDDAVLVYDEGCYHQHQALSGHVLSAISDPSSDAFHGTHVAGVLLGEYAKYVNGGGISGVASRAHFVLKDFVHSPLLSTVLSAPGIAIANHSWGFNPPSGPYFGYHDDCREMDGFASDYHDVLSITAAGRQSGDVEAPGTAKNTLTVGAIPYATADTTWEVLGMKHNTQGVGPTYGDNRLKPDLVAPGGTQSNGVVSCESPTLPFGEATWDPAYGGYSLLEGSSAATPHVTGVAAVVANWYTKWILDNGHAQDPNYAPTSQLYRALLVNTAIPLRWNGDAPGPFPSSFLGGTVATDETRRAFANVEYGYGLVNGYSGVFSHDDEYRRVLIWQDTVEWNAPKDTNFIVQSSPFGGTGQPRYLVVTMAYDDIPAPTADPSPMRDRLELTLISPQGEVHHFTPPPLTIAGTIEKMIIPWPSVELGGIWTAVVTFASTTDTRVFPQQSFAVVADVMDEAPRLSVEVANSHTVKTGQPIRIPVIVRNTGGNVAAGVTVRIDDPQHRLSFADTTFYVGNLLKGGDSAKFVLARNAPLTAQDVTLNVKVDLINKMVDGGPYPWRETVTVHVVDMRTIKGRLTVLPGSGSSVQGAAILVNGVPSDMTADDGLYEVEVPKNSTVTIKPRKGTTIFLPPDTTYASVSIDKDQQNYKARYHKVSGFITDENGARIDGVGVAPRTASGTTFRAQPGTTNDIGRFDAYGYAPRFLNRSSLC